MISNGINAIQKGSFTIKSNIFIENKGINISHGNSNLFIEFCLFVKCSKDRGGSIFLSSPNNKAKIKKICGRNCFLEGGDRCGVFFWCVANQEFDQISYCNHPFDSNSRDICNHETGSQLIENVNVSHVNAQRRGFAWYRPNTGNKLTFNFGIGYNITCYYDLLQVYNAESSSFNFLSIAACTTLEGNVFEDVDNYFFVARNDYCLNNCMLRNNRFVNLFYGNPQISSCNIDYSSVNVLSTENFFSHNIFCKASDFRLCSRRHCKCNAHTSYIISQFVLICLQ